MLSKLSLIGCVLCLFVAMQQTFDFNIPSCTRPNETDLNLRLQVELVHLTKTNPQNANDTVLQQNLTSIAMNALLSNDTEPKRKFLEAYEFNRFKYHYGLNDSAGQFLKREYGIQYKIINMRREIWKLKYLEQLLNNSDFNYNSSLRISYLNDQINALNKTQSVESVNVTLPVARRRKGHKTRQMAIDTTTTTTTIATTTTAVPPVSGSELRWLVNRVTKENVIADFNLKLENEREYLTFLMKEYFAQKLKWQIDDYRQVVSFALRPGTSQIRKFRTLNELRQNDNLVKCMINSRGPKDAYVAAKFFLQTI